MMRRREYLGATLAAGVASLLTANDIHAYNSFDNPRRIEPKDEQIALTRLQITLV